MARSASQASCSKRNRRPSSARPRRVDPVKAIALCFVALSLSACAAVQAPCNLRLQPVSRTGGAKASLTPSEYGRYLKNLSGQALAAERAAATTELASADRLSRRIQLAMVLSHGDAKDVARATALLEDGLRKERGLVTCDKVAGQLVLDSLKDRRRVTDGLTTSGNRRSQQSAALREENEKLKQELKSVEAQTRSLSRQLEQLKAIEKQIDEREREAQTPSGASTSDAEGQNPAGR
jgi:hypothetical protein